MSNPEYMRILVERGAAARIANPARIRRDQLIDRAFRRDGGLHEDVLAAVRSPLTYRWHFAGTVAAGIAAGADRVSRPGRLVLLAAYTPTAPSGGACAIELQTNAGLVLGVVTLAAGMHQRESEIEGVTLTAGTWILPVVVSANGAANLSVVAVQEMD